MDNHKDTPPDQESERPESPDDRITRVIEEGIEVDPSLQAISEMLIVDFGSCSTISVSPEMLFFNEGFVDTLSDAQLLLILRHEARHLLDGHAEREKNVMAAIEDGKILSPAAAQAFRQPDGAWKRPWLKLFWNAAADLSINESLRDDPSFAHTDPTAMDCAEFEGFRMQGTVEEIFSVLLNDVDARNRTMKRLKNGKRIELGTESDGVAASNGQA